MMMAILQAGGVELLVDNQRQADKHNPHGYFEHQDVLTLSEQSDFLRGQSGRAVKIIYRLLKHIPKDIRQKVIFLERDLTEVIASQNRMLLERQPDLGHESTSELKALFGKELDRCRTWLSLRPQIQVLWIPHRDLIDRPKAAVSRLANFLERDLDLEAMAAVIDQNLVHQRAAGSSKA